MCSRIVLYISTYNDCYALPTLVMASFRVVEDLFGGMNFGIRNAWLTLSN
jgi:hypothetical protein